MVKIPITDKSSEYKCEFIKLGNVLNLWILETDRWNKGTIWYPTFSKFCNHNPRYGECINCGLVIEGDE